MSSDNSKERKPNDSLDKMSGKDTASYKKGSKTSVIDVLQRPQGCPHLAVFDDPDTRLLFPSPAGYCHHVQPAQGVNIEHQQGFCLSVQYKRCPAFVLENLTELPPEVGRTAVKNTNGRLLKIIVAIVVMTALALGAWFLGGYNNRSDNSAAAFVPPPTATTAPTKTTTPTKPPLPAIIAPVAEGVETAVSSTAVPQQTPTTEPTIAPSPTATPTVQPTATATTAPTVTSEPLPVAEVIPGRLNIRGGPSTNYPILTTVETGTLFDLSGQLSDGSWYQLCCVEGEFGWVLAESVNVTNLTGDIPVVANIPPLPEN